MEAQASNQLPLPSPLAPLSQIVRMAVKIAHKDLLKLSQKLATLDDSDGSCKYECQKTFQRMRIRFIRLLVLVESLATDKVTDLVNADAILKSIEDHQRYFLDSWHFMGTTSGPARLDPRAPLWEISTGIDVAAHGDYKRLPAFIENITHVSGFIPRELRLTKDLRPQVLKKIEEAIYVRLLSETVPDQFTTLKVENGKLMCTVEDEFTASLTLWDGPAPTAAWTLLHIKFHVGPENVDHFIGEFQAEEIRRTAHQRIQHFTSKPFVELYRSLHYVVKKIVFDVLHKQAITQKLHNTGLVQVNNIQYSEERLMIEYWGVATPAQQASQVVGQRDEKSQTNSFSTPLKNDEDNDKEKSDQERVASLLITVDSKNDQIKVTHVPPVEGQMTSLRASRISSEKLLVEAACFQIEARLAQLHQLLVDSPLATDDMKIIVKENMDVRVPSHLQIPLAGTVSLCIHGCLRDGSFMLVTSSEVTGVDLESLEQKLNESPSTTILEVVTEVKRKSVIMMFKKMSIYNRLTAHSNVPLCNSKDLETYFPGDARIFLSFWDEISTVLLVVLADDDGLPKFYFSFFEQEQRRWKLKVLRPLRPFCYYTGEELSDVEVKIRGNVVDQPQREDEDEEDEEDGQHYHKKRKTSHGLPWRAENRSSSWIGLERASRVFKKLISAARFAFWEECIFGVFERYIANLTPSGGFPKKILPNHEDETFRDDDEDEQDEIHVTAVYPCDCSVLKAKEMTVLVEHSWSVTICGSTVIPHVKWKSVNDEQSKIEYDEETGEWRFSYKRTKPNSVTEYFIENDYKPFLRLFNLVQQFSDSYRELAPNTKIVYLSPKSLCLSFPTTINDYNNKNNHTNGHNHNNNDNEYNNNRLLLTLSSLSTGIVLNWHLPQNNTFAGCKDMEALASVVGRELTNGADIGFLFNCINYSVPSLYALHRWILRSLLVFQSKINLKQHLTSKSALPMLPSHLLPIIDNNNDNNNNDNNIGIEDNDSNGNGKGNGSSSDIMGISPTSVCLSLQNSNKARLLFFSQYAIDVLFLGRGGKALMLFQEPSHVNQTNKVSKIRIPEFNYFISTQKIVDDNGSATISYRSTDHAAIELFLSNLYVHLNRHFVSLTVLDHPHHKQLQQTLQNQQQAVVIYLTQQYDYFLFSFINHSPHVEFVFHGSRQVFLEEYVQNKILYIPCRSVKIMSFMQLLRSRWVLEIIELVTEELKYNKRQSPIAFEIDWSSVMLAPANTPDNAQKLQLEFEIYQLQNGILSGAVVPIIVKADRQLLSPPETHIRDVGVSSAIVRALVNDAAKKISNDISEGKSPTLLQCLQYIIQSPQLQACLKPIYI